MNKEMEEKIKSQLRLKSTLYCYDNPNVPCKKCLDKISGDVNGISGNVSRISGNVSGISGNVNEIKSILKNEDKK